MSCSPFDLRDYHFQELTDAQRRQVESHVKTCEPCREELGRLQFTESALFTLREEEIPQRIAFVSDPIFEPSPLRRFLTDFWGSAAKLGFASAAMLSAALMVFSLTRPAPATVQLANGVDVQAIVEAAVTKKTQALTADLEKAREQLLWAAEELDQSQKRNGAQRLNAGLMGPPREQLETLR
jgi:anti-sigma factor RsiW